MAMVFSIAAEIEHDLISQRTRSIAGQKGERNCLLHSVTQPYAVIWLWMVSQISHTMFVALKRSFIVLQEQRTGLLN